MGPCSQSVFGSMSNLSPEFRNFTIFFTFLSFGEREERKFKRDFTIILEVNNFHLKIIIYLDYQ